MFYIKAKALELAEKALSIDEFDSSITVIRCLIYIFQPQAKTDWIFLS